ncbi:MAG: hypothetical protein KKB81_05780 [Candidatus Margulisbacteria bacterium]|nr:hypothetical protein [Candidatus Margulisiibacteriota bacterium]MBU1021844.1 hypothetical protein [Candidatus Margulisiibacteriota bacterium]MBU1729003.1 hypothetical protein [Candidatus Margulisiibacteriota bacterium]MBU1954444.1 hypothetical protein [Candidatus Margulisiibacteriota bacterium]
MSLHFIFTVDGDWKAYFNRNLSEEKRKPNENTLANLIEREIHLAKSLLNGRFIHFVHASPRAKEYFSKPQFITLWKQIEQNGGNIGVHCHEEDPYLKYYYNQADRMRKAITDLAQGLKSNGLSPKSYRGGFMTFSPKLIPILEENEIFIDFSCEPGRYLMHGDKLVSDWRNAPTNYYRLNYKDHRRSGDSKVFEIPVGSANGNFLNFEKSSLWKIWQIARNLKKQATENIVVSVLAHTYEFSQPLKLLKIKLGLLILRIYGKFINVAEAREVIGN